MTIFDLVKAGEITAYWETLVQDRPPYFFESLFPANKQMSLELKWLKGASGTPVVLSPSAFDAAAIPIERQGFKELSTYMPFFKQAAYIDEELRQQLNIMMSTGNQTYIDTIMNKIFDDEVVLLESAAAQRERMRAMAVTTGAIAISANGQSFAYDFGMPSDHKATVTTSWSDPTADILGDIDRWMKKIEEDTGVLPTRAVCQTKVLGYMRNNDVIKKSIYILSQGQAMITDSQVTSYISDTLGLEIVTYDKRYKTEAGVTTPFVPEDTFVLFPTGDLGYTNFGTTPAESDLMSNPSLANVSITDTGVAVATVSKADPVQVETIVSMICLPSFEQADQVFIAQVKTS
jgi:hypothetical protein